MGKRKKTSKTYKGKGLEPGGGGQFAKMVDALKEDGKTESEAQAIAAAHGRKKYGKAAFQKMAENGRRRATARKRKGGDALKKSEQAYGNR